LKITKYLASASQKRLWFVQQLGGASYNISQAFKLEGVLDYALLQDSLNSVIARHSPLRTTFEMDGNALYQIVYEELSIKLGVEEFSEKALSKNDESIQLIIDNEFKQSFNFDGKSPVRAKIFQLSPTEHVFTFVVHQINFDRHSEGLLISELNHLYNNRRAIKNVTLTDFTIDYSNYIIWKQNKERGPDKEIVLNYWKSRLDGITPQDLPYDNSRGLTLSANGNRLYLNLPALQVRKLEKIANQQSATLFMGLLAIFKVLIFRWAGIQDIVVGTPFSDRKLSGTKKLIGFFVNSIVLRTQLGDNDTFADILKRISKTCLGAYRYNDLPLEQLVEELQSNRQINRNPIFDLEFVFQKPHKQKLQLDGLDIFPLIPSKASSEYDMTLIVREKESEYDVSIEYRTDLFEQLTIERLLERYKLLLEKVVEFPNQSVSSHKLLTEEERKLLLETWNNTQVQYPHQLNIHQLIEKQSDLSPQSIAVIDKTAELTYQELERRANQLAFYLIEQGVKANVLVGICVERNTDMLVCLLAILKSGGAYLPLDKTYPTARIDYMLKDSKVSVLITQSSIITQLPSSNLNILLIDKIGSDVSKLSSSRPNLVLSASNIAYIIYTSGSTGNPKGVKVTHRNVVNFLTGMKSKPGLDFADILVAVTTLSFDIAVLELFLPLISGAKIVIADHETTIDGDKLKNLLIQSKCTIMQATPISWRLLLNAGWRGHASFKVLCGGEALPRDLLSKMLESVDYVWNMYGPTETTVWSTCSKISSDKQAITVGKPINNTEVFVLTPQKELALIGTVGELYIGGHGVTMGYLNREELTADRFIENNITNGCSKLYRTGDAVKFRNDGNIEYIGRFDSQVKLRGNRIELGEIETAIQSHNLVDECIMLINSDKYGEPCIIS
jgi:amino acid adenylation domain-containing protein